MSALPVALHELLVAPLAAGLALRHMTLALGLRRAALEFSALVLYGYLLERVAIAVFASHDYGGGWRFAPGGVPLAVAFAWAAVIASSLAVATRRGFAAPGTTALAAALIGTSLDMLMEPVAVRAGLWRWTPPGPWLSVPIGNFVGWGVIVGVYALGAELGRESASQLGLATRRLLLAAGSVAALVLVGLAWQRAGAEAAFKGARGFLAFALVLVATLGVRGLRRAPAPDSTTLAGRLGAGSVRLPALALLLLALSFAADAVLLRDATVLSVALCVFLTLVFVLPDLVPVSVVERWRRASFAALAEASDLVRVLMKPRNRERWTPDDRAFLRAQLRALARWAPALFLFLLPGSFILLPAYAWVLDRRRGKDREAPPAVSETVS